MTDDHRSLERAARSWLDAGPTHAPDRSVAAALARIQSITQERRVWMPWKPSPVGIRYAAAVSVVALAVAIGAVSWTPIGGPGKPGPTTTLAPTLPPPSGVSALPTGVSCSDPPVPDEAIGSGCIEVPQTWQVDLETSRLAEYDKGDLWLEADDQLYLASTGRARLRIQGEDGPGACRDALASEPAPPVEDVTSQLKSGDAHDRLAISATTPDTRLCLESRHGELFQLRVVGFGEDRIIGGGRFSVIVLAWIHWGPLPPASL